MTHTSTAKKHVNKLQLCTQYAVKQLVFTVDAERVTES